MLMDIHKEGYQAEEIVEGIQKESIHFVLQQSNRPIKNLVSIRAIPRLIKISIVVPNRPPIHMQ